MRVANMGSIRVSETMLFMLGFASAGGSTLAVLSIAVHVAQGLEDCPECCQYLLIGTLVGGTLGGLAALWVLKLAYMVLGGSAGGALGYAAYILFLHNYSLGDGTLNRDGMLFLSCGLGGEPNALASCCARSF